MIKMQVTKEASVTAKNLSKVVFFRVVQYPFLALYVMIVPRYLGPEAYGRYAFLMSIAFIFSSMLSVGGNAAVFGRFVPEFQHCGRADKIGRLSTNLMTLKTIFDVIVITSVTSVLIATYSGNYPNDYFILVAIIIVLMDMQTVPDSLLYGLNDLGKYSFPGAAKKILTLVMVPILYSMYGIEGALLSALLIELAILCFLCGCTRHYFSLSNISIDSTLVLSLLKYDVLYYMCGSLFVIWTKLGNALIQHITHNPTEVAVFDIANQLFMISVISSKTIITANIPILTTLFLDGHEHKMYSWNKLIIKYMWFIACAATIVFACVGKDLIVFVIGKAYSNVYNNALISIGCAFVISITDIGYVYATIYVKPHMYLRAIGGAVLSFVVASVILIPMYASLGCSAAMFISCCVMALTLMTYFRKQIVGALRDGLVVVIVGLLCATVGFYHGTLNARIALLCLSLSTYMIVLYMLGTFNIHELLQVADAIVKRPKESQSMV